MSGVYILECFGERGMSETVIFSKKITWCILSIIWLCLMFFLSHQNGPDTFYTSHGLTVWLAQLLGTDVELTHGVIRKIAHDSSCGAVFCVGIAAVRMAGLVRAETVDSACFGCCVFGDR